MTAYPSIVTAPAAPVMREERVATGDGPRLHLRTWEPETWEPEAPARAVLVVCHGLNAHGAYYTATAGAFAAAGFAVAAPDLRGRGKSEGERFFVTDIAEYVADVDAVVTLLRSRHPGAPVFLLGHSAGGVVACVYALEHPTVLSGLICESFAFRVPAPGFALKAIAWLSRSFPRFGVLKLKNADFSRDPAAVAAMNADPLIAGETQPAATVAALVRADARLETGFPAIVLPLLILHGTADKVTLPAGSQFFHDISGSPDKTLKLYDGHVHDLLADLGREAVLADIVAWTEARLPEPDSPAA